MEDTDLTVLRELVALLVMNCTDADLLDLLHKLLLESGVI